MEPVVLGPDVFVNASVAPGTPPDTVARNMLGGLTHKVRVTPWIMERVAAMLAAHPGFLRDHVEPQLELIRGLVDVVEDEHKFKPDQWAEALASAAKAAKLARVITDHPDLIEKGAHDGVDFESTETFAIELALPPPPPPDAAKKASPPDAAKELSAPDAAKEPSAPDAAKEPAAPDAAKEPSAPDAAKEPAAPDAAEESSAPDDAKKE